MLPLPCPDAGDASDTHPAGVVTLQAHSGAAVIATVPIPPSDSIGAGSVTLSWHFTREGAVETTVVLDVPQATMLIIAAARITGRSSGGRDEDLVGIAAQMNALQAQSSCVHSVSQRSRFKTPPTSSRGGTGFVEPSCEVHASWRFRAQPTSIVSDRFEIVSECLAFSERELSDALGNLPAIRLAGNADPLFRETDHMRLRVCLPLLLLVLAPIPAWAEFINAKSADALERESVSRTLPGGSVIYEAPGSGQQRPLAEGFQTGPDRLLGGLTSSEVNTGARTGLIDGGNQGESTPSSATTIPGPSSLIVGVGGALVALALGLRRRSRTSMA